MNFPFTFGWNQDKAPEGIAAVKDRIQAQGKAPTFAQAAGYLYGTGAGETVILHDLAKKLFGGKYLQSQYQPRGTCVSRGAKRIVDLTQVIQIVSGRLPFDFQYISHAYIYGTCREHGGDLSRQDGAVGAWAAWAVNHDGNLTNQEANDDDNKDDLAFEWGWHGVPDSFKQKGRLHLVKSITQANSFEEVRDAIVNGHGVTCASSIGFEGLRNGNAAFSRDSEGRAHRGGTWPHQMCFTGYRADKDWLLVDQSWGGDNPDGPLGSIEIPTYSFWASKADAQAMIGEGDTWVFSAFDGYPAQKIHWYA